MSSLATTGLAPLHKTAAAAAVVAAKGINHAFDIGAARKQVLFDIDFRLDRGEFVILTGPSGAGKPFIPFGFQT